MRIGVGDHCGYGVWHSLAVLFVNSQAPAGGLVTSRVSSFANDPAEIVLRDWVKRAKHSQRDGARLLAQFLREAKRERGKVEQTAQEALVSAAGMLRREVDQLQRGLTGVSRRLATFEQEQKKKPARTPAKAPVKTTARRARRTPAGSKRKLRKAA
jgi:polyhydroxyalkanoate synthesis regulator phasin